MIRQERAHLYIAAATHAGMRGKNNEDRFSVSAYRLGVDDVTPAVFAIVCDGIGGHRAGEVAAEIAVEKISNLIAQSDGTQPVSALRDAIGQASQSIREQAQRNTAQKGMGATCVCVLVIGNRLFAASVGDSRLYLLRGDTIRQLTIDHTWVQEAVEYGALTPEQARKHPNAHVIRRHLGSQTPVVPDFRLKLVPGETSEQSEANQGLSLIPGDRLLMCTDGLTDLVDDNEIQGAMTALERTAALEQLINLANQRGGHDNITIVTLEAPVGRPETRRLIVKDMLPVIPRKPWPLALTCLAAATILAVIAALVVGGIFAVSYLRRPTPTPTVSPTITMTRPAFAPPPKATITPSPSPLPSPTSSPTIPSPTIRLRDTSTQIPVITPLVVSSPSPTLIQITPPRP